MKKALKILMIILLIGAVLFAGYFNNSVLVNKKTVRIYSALKDSLRSNGFRPHLLMISGKRVKLHNALQVKISRAAAKSKHLSGDAIDFLVFDINSDGRSDSADVNIVYNILDKHILKSKGGLGTYKNERLFIDRQMIHIDCREQ